MSKILLICLVASILVGCNSEIKKAQKEVDDALEVRSGGITVDEILEGKSKLDLCKAYQKLGNAYLKKKDFQIAKSRFLMSLECFDDILLEYEMQPIYEIDSSSAY